MNKWKLIVLLIMSITIKAQGQADHSGVDIHTTGKDTVSLYLGENIIIDIPKSCIKRSECTEDYQVIVYSFNNGWIALYRGNVSFVDVPVIEKWVDYLNYRSCSGESLNGLWRIDDYNKFCICYCNAEERELFDYILNSLVVQTNGY